MAGEDDDARHRREEAERRAKRKAYKQSASEAQRRKERERKEYRQKILQKHGHSTSGVSGSSNKRQKKETVPKGSAFQELFTQRAQGFQIDFRFRNAPPRPPVGPCFVGETINAVMLSHSKQYKPLNSVEVHHTWKLHTEPDIGVPLAPSAMDLKSYKDTNSNVDLSTSKLHPDDEALLNWKGSFGDTAAEQLKRRQEQARATARMAALGRLPKPANKQELTKAQKLEAHLSNKDKKKAFSRVLKEGMQTWMKKTTYLSNDYSRKVHDFKSLAQTKSELAVELQSKQNEMEARRSVKAIEESFAKAANPATLKHPSNPNLKPKNILSVLPDVGNWGRAFTHVVVDKAPFNLPKGQTVNNFKYAFITDVEQKKANARMSCRVLAPAPKERLDELDEKDKPETISEDQKPHEPVQMYDLDVIPLKEEDAPHMSFTLWVDREKSVCTYVPVASRVQLMTGRPIREPSLRFVQRRPLTNSELTTMEERMAEVDQDMADKHHVNTGNTHGSGGTSFLVGAATSKKRTIDDDSDGENDFGNANDDDDSDSEEEEVFGNGAKTIVAES